MRLKTMVMKMSSNISIPQICLKFLAHGNYNNFFKYRETITLARQKFM